MGEQSLGIRLRLVYSDSDADAGMDLVGVDQERQFHRIDELPSQYSGIGRLVDSDINTANSSPPKRATVSDAADLSHQPLRHRLEQAVADRVTQRVVHVLEIIEIEIEDGNAAVAPPRVGYRVLETASRTRRDLPGRSARRTAIS